MQLDAWLTDEPVSADCDQITRHLEECQLCHAFFSDLQALRQKVRHVPRADMQEVDARMMAILQEIADQQKATQKARTEDKRKRWWLAAAAGVPAAAVLFSAFDTPWASRLFTVGVVLNLCGLLCLPVVLRSSREWNRA